MIMWVCFPVFLWVWGLCVCLHLCALQQPGWPLIIRLGGSRCLWMYLPPGSHRAQGVWDSLYFGVAHVTLPAVPFSRRPVASWPPQTPPMDPHHPTLVLSPAKPALHLITVQLVNTQHSPSELLSTNNELAGTHTAFTCENALVLSPAQRETPQIDCV